MYNCINMPVCFKNSLFLTQEPVFMHAKFEQIQRNVDARDQSSLI